MRDQAGSVRVLVTAGSKHGSTKEIAERIGEMLSKRALDVYVQDPQFVLDLSDFDAVVLGSAVYAGHWVSAAKEIANLIAREDPRPLTWLFSSGPVGEPAVAEEEPVDVADIIEATSAREHRVFSGRIDKSKLGFGERAILIAVRATEGDFCDWTEIDTWAEHIAELLVEAAQKGKV